MITAFYTASTGTMQTQKGMDVVANNVANISTNGYKPSTVSFSDLLYTNMQADGVKAGHGTKLNHTNTVYSVGSFQTTNRSLDFALCDENSFFAVQTQDGIKYTRVGNFHLSEKNGQFYLTSQQNGYVLGADNRPIAVDPKNIEDGITEIDVGVFTFPNTDGLIREGDNFFSPTQTSGNAQVFNQAKVKQGCIEASTVNMADEVTNMIQMQKAFQLNCRMVQISDEVMQTVNNLR